MRPLAELIRNADVLEHPSGIGHIPIAGITSDSRRLRKGEVYIAVRGAVEDGHDHVLEAVERGAAAVVAERPVHVEGAPVLRVRDSRAALASIAAAWYGRPADRLLLVGITGTLGKTSVLSMLAAIGAAAERPLGTVGSLGVHFREPLGSGPLTTPGPIELHSALSSLAERGADVVAMEVTSHALDQRRVHGLSYGLGIFTNLTLLEHLDYHGNFRRYVEAKRRFLDHLAPEAPLIVPVGDRLVRALVEEYPRRVTVGPGGIVSLRTEPRRHQFIGTSITLTHRRPLPRLDGGEVEPGGLPITLRVLGRGNVGNAALAAVAGLCLGYSPEQVAGALEAFEAPWRRMQVVYRGDFTVLDDTVGHPDSISAVFDLVRKCRYRRLHVVYAIRGRRGTEINHRDAQSVAIWSRCVPIATMIVTASEDAADEANRVAPEERAAFLKALRADGLAHVYRARLSDAIETVLEAVGTGDLILLLGAQGMDRGGSELLARLGDVERIGDGR